MRALALAAALSLCAASSAFAEEPLDASKSMTCALTGASECSSSASCTEVQIEQLDLPETVRVDLPRKQLVSPEGDRTSPISTVETLAYVLVLQGSQEGRGWTMVIERETGLLAATIASADGSIVLAGGCTRE